ncbi:zinc-ribbon domain-containing protein [Oceanobacillus alkalisoli]|uniref:zinc-ribbon domain-containing protein n=1 Tax=Oceanobacillus alkalisoli TaxID=2925113 RepID=UPI001F120A14|nr:zinc-ribbon domain-containing protein [Oceanobacillus alkalisoli]MCF3944751.1 zinc-ribbon domain-containing protein [Oceanobacillus alkalisoli]
MYYCPNCGTKVKEEEHFCLKCGKSLPDIDSRLEPARFQKWWILPIATLIIVISSVFLFSTYLNHQSTKAVELYTEAENSLLDEDYEQASQLLQSSLDYRKDFSQAQVALQYTNEALQIDERLKKTDQLLQDRSYNEALDILHVTEDKLKTYQGPVVSKLVEKINQTHASVLLEQLKTKLEDSPSIDEIRMLIWEAEEINHSEANDIVTQLRNELVEYTFSTASEALNNKQFNDAQLITEDGLKYAPDAEKLQSLLANINKEKSSFEAAAQERLEQAMDTAYQEHQMNENDAIELNFIDVENDEDGRIVVKGAVKSNATVPINSILVKYTVSRNDEEILTNEIFVYPDTLYPTEQGKFEFTHFDLKDKSSNLEAAVKKITWYTD